LEIRKFITIVLVTQLAVAVLMALSLLGINIPILQQFIGFIYLTFFPGLLILRILKIHNLGNTKTILYTVGLSFVFVMFTGYIINMLYPILGIPRPISHLPLLFTFAIAVIILCALAYLQERRDTNVKALKINLSWAEVLSPPVLLLILLPLISAIGAYYLANVHQNTIVLLILLALITLIALSITFNKFIEPKLYPFAIAMIAIALLWHVSLISLYIWGYDIHHDYYFQNIVLTNGVWDSTLRSNVNSMLACVILNPIYSIFLNIDTVWIYKIFYPLFFSLLPVTLFLIFRKQTTERISFFAVFFFMSFSAFFMSMQQLARQQISEVFFALFVLLLLDDRIAATQRKLLLIICGFSIVISHYGLSYFVFLYLILAMLIPLIWRSTLSKILLYISEKFRRGRVVNETGISTQNLPGAVISTNTLTTTLVLIFITFCLLWYMYIGAGSPFRSIVNIGDHIFNSIAELFILEAREPSILMAVGLAAPEVISLQRNVFLIIQYITQLFIIIGVLGLLFNRIKAKFYTVYVAMTVTSCIILLLSIIIPRFTGYLNMDRIYHITLLFLSPFCILGGIAVFRGLFRLARLKNIDNYSNTVWLSLVVIIILVPYFLFNTAFIYAVTGDKITSIALNPDWDTPRYNKQEISGKEWLLSNMEEESQVAVDYYGVTWLVEKPFFRKTIVIYGDTETIPDNTYIFLRSINVKEGMVKKSSIELPRYVDIRSSEFGEEVLNHRNRIYSNGGTQLYDRS